MSDLLDETPEEALARDEFDARHKAEAIAGAIEQSELTTEERMAEVPPDERVFAMVHWTFDTAEDAKEVALALQNATRRICSLGRFARVIQARPTNEPNMHVVAIECQVDR